ncbi:MAG: TolC family protein [Deltaproteobacteria bacterium]|nr:TolC family protein [Deltaproteobacteria bacterium]
MRARLRIISIAALSIGILLRLPAHAAPSQRFTLDAAIQRALHEHPKLAAAREQTTAARARIKQAGTLEDPMIEAMLIERGDIDMEGTGFGVSQSIPFPWKLRHQRQQARHAADRQAAEASMTASDLRAEVQIAFFQLLFLDQQLGLERSLQQLLEHYTAVAETRYATGEALFGDPLKAGSEAAARGARSIELTRDRAAVVARLTYLLALRPGTAFSLVAPKGLVPFRWSRADVIARIEGDRPPQLRKAEAQVGETKSGVAVARAGYGPDLRASANYMRRGEGTVSANLGLSIPLYFGKHRAQVHEAEALWRASVHEREDTALRLRSEALQLYERMQAARTVAGRYSRDVMPRAEAVVRSAETAYQSQKTEFVSLIDAIRQQREYQLTYRQAVTEYEQLRAELERLLGFTGENP